MQNSHITDRIKSLCKEKGIAISAILSECGLTKSFIYDTEKRKASPSCANISKLADALDCSTDFLLGRTDNPEVNR